MDTTNAIRTVRGTISKDIEEKIELHTCVLGVVQKKNGSVRITLGKKINGHAVVVVLASRGRKSIQPVTAWQNDTEHYLRKYGQKKTRTIDTSHSPEGEESGYKQLASEVSIPQTAQNVNPETGQQVEKPGQTGLSIATAEPPAGTLLSEVYDLARRMGTCGQKGLSQALEVRRLGGDFNETHFLIGYIDVYLAALKGLPHGPAYLPATVDSHARQLTLVERMQAYHNGVNDAKARTQAAQNVNPDTGISQAAAQGQTTEQGDKAEIFGEDGADSMGKSAGEAELSKPGEPVQIGTVDFADKKTVLAQLDSAQKETADLDHEVNYSVTTDGKVWRVSGECGTVNPSAIPSSRVGSYSYHNHPRAKTWGSFSADDVKDFFESGEQFSKCSDHLYEYVMERTKDTVAIDPDVVYHRFKEIENTEVFTMKAKGEIDPNMDAYHEVMKILSRKLGLHYERKKKNQ